MSSTACQLTMSTYQLIILTCQLMLFTCQIIKRFFKRVTVNMLSRLRYVIHLKCVGSHGYKIGEIRLKKIRIKNMIQHAFNARWTTHNVRRTATDATFFYHSTTMCTILILHTMPFTNYLEKHTAACKHQT